MEIKYENYSIEALYDILNHIDREKYPERLKQVKDEIERRESDPEFQKSQALKIEQKNIILFGEDFLRNGLMELC